jgi:hypothetical protein
LYFERSIYIVCRDAGGANSKVCIQRQGNQPAKHGHKTEASQFLIGKLKQLHSAKISIWATYPACPLCGTQLMLSDVSYVVESSRSRCKVNSSLRPMAGQQSIT